MASVAEKEEEVVEGEVSRKETEQIVRDYLDKLEEHNKSSPAKETAVTTSLDENGTNGSKQERENPVGDAVDAEMDQEDEKEVENEEQEEEKEEDSTSDQQDEENDKAKGEEEEQDEQEQDNGEVQPSPSPAAASNSSDTPSKSPQNALSDRDTPDSRSSSTAAAVLTSEMPTNKSGEERSDTWKPRILPADFQPSPAHVLCGRRKGHKDFGGNWPGNLALEEVIAEHLGEYESATDKDGIIVKILAQVRRCKGGFVRISLLVDDEKKAQQRWMDVGDVNARKDVAAIFRLFLQARRHKKTPKQLQAAAARPTAAVHLAQQRQQLPPLRPPPPPPPVAQRRPHPPAHPLPPPQSLQKSFQLQTKDLQSHVQRVAKAHVSQNSRNSALPTKLYAVESGGEVKKTPFIRKRTTAALENTRTVVPPSETAQQLPLAGLATVASTQKSVTIPEVSALQTTHHERAKKRRSLEESLAADALQLIARTATADEESTTNSDLTVRRRSGVKIPRPRPSNLETESNPKKGVRVCCLQLGQRIPSESPWDATQRALTCLTSVAQNEQDVDLFVLPELCPFGSSQDTFLRYLPLSTEWQHLYKRVDEAFAEHARILGVYIVYGTIGWFVRESDRSLRFKLSHKVVDRQGQIVAVHDKAYLSDLEFRFFDAGHRKTVTFNIDGFTFGLLVGDDLKYPNLARGLARDNDVDVIVHPSASATPLYFRQCRAVENSLYVLGVEYNTGATVACPPDPDHDPVCMGSRDDETEEGYLLTHIQWAALEYARTNFSHYRHMKTEVR